MQFRTIFHAHAQPLSTHFFATKKCRIFSAGKLAKAEEQISGEKNAAGGKIVCIFPRKMAAGDETETKNFFKCRKKGRKLQIYFW